MGATRTTTAVQRYLDELRARPEETGAPQVVRELLGRSAMRRLNRSRVRLASLLKDLEPQGGSPGADVAGV